ncbi:MAG: carboxypeptidase-like regulatory domain-containing protein [Acidobacteriia bacterium]|nr:carboxypeptidase-like regulatory domain-containing protein [Terriglobia bacterium]
MTALVLILGAAIAPPLQAQYTVGRLEGTIFDATGAVVSGTKVSLRSLGTGATRTYITGADGLYVFFAMPAGDYQLTAEAQHFATKSERIQIVTSETTNRNLTLGVGPQSATVEVVGEPGLLNTADAQHSTTRTDLELSSLPSSGRNMISLIHLAPGVAPMNNPRGGSTFGGGGSLVIVLGPQAGLFSANGGRARSGSVQLDYTDANDWEFGGFALGMQSITPEMLQEFKLLTSNFSAEYGVKSNAEVIMVSKSGTNQLHGSAYDFVQNTLFNARDYLDRSGSATPVQSNIYGVSAGGPVLHNRTFLFGAYERRSIRGNAFTTLANLPTQAARDAAAADPNADPIAIALMNQYLPLPRIATSNPDVGQLVTKIPSPIDSYQFLLKGDEQLTTRQSLSVRYLQSSGSFVARSAGANQIPGFDTDIHFALNNVNLTDSYAVSMRTVNQLRLSYGYARALSLPQNGVTTPRFQMVGAYPLNFGSLQSNPQERRFNIYQVNDTLSHTRGTHILSVGFDVRQIHDNSRADTNTRGVFTFTTVPVPGQTWMNFTEGGANFAKGPTSSWTQLFGSTQRDLRTGVYSFFFQDDWKVRPTLTINLGARWELQGALNEGKGRISILDPALPGAVGEAPPGPLGSFRLGGPAVDRNPFNVAPRLGFAWNPHRGNVVFRGGYGIYWDSFTFDLLTVARSAPPFNYQPSLSCAGSACQISGTNSFDNLVNGTAKIQSDTEAQLGSFGPQPNFGSVNTVNPQLRNPYAQQYSFGMEYQFARSYRFGLSYIGSKGTHLTRLVPINPVVDGPAPATSTADETARFTDFQLAIKNENGPGNKRLDSRFNQVNRLDDGASSNYNSLQVTGNKSFSHGLQFQASYTWSKSIDNASDFFPAIQANDNSYAQDAFQLGAERAVSNFDIRHRIIITGVWQVPFFRSRKGVAGKVLDGWSFESVNLWQSAVPATLLAGTRTIQDASGDKLAVADVNLDGNFISPSLDNTRPNCDPAGTHFTLGAPAAISGFSQPLLGNDGTCGRNSVRMNSLPNFDWSFFKDTELSESGPWGSGPWKLQFRAEMYNIFNLPFRTAQGDAWRTITSSSFGTVNAAGNARKMQLALKLSW